MTAPSRGTRWICRAVALALAGLLVASVARFYHPPYGFTALIGFPSGEGNRLPVLETIPHIQHHPSSSYDGQFYAQLALDPLLRDPALDRALDSPAYRARRILFSWTAWVLGAGRPSWILQAYALQNVLAWLILAVVMSRWLSPESPRGLALWIACLFSDGLLSSVRLALLDGPSVLLLAVAIAASERGRHLTTAAIVGVAGLGRETNLLGAMALPPAAGRWRWVRLGLALVLIVLPLLLWQDYLRSIYRSTSLAGQSQLDQPVVVYLHMWAERLHEVRRTGVISPGGQALGVMIGLTVQTAYLLYRRQVASPWWRVALAYALLVFAVSEPVWEGHPGAITRVTLPLLFGFNVLLAREAGPRFWLWFIVGNLHLIPARTALPILAW
jgi:hypothetical protein